MQFDNTKTNCFEINKFSQSIVFLVSTDTSGDYYHVYTSGLSKNLICIPVRYNSNLFLNAVELSSETKNVVFRMYKASKHLIISYS